MSHPVQNFYYHSAGNSSGPRSYIFADPHPPHSITFYRLLTVDVDGTSAYSKIVTVKMPNGADLFSISPNPAEATLTMRLSRNGLFMVKIVSPDGKVLSERLLECGGTIPATLDISGLPQGVYIIVVQNADERMYRRFVRQ